MKFFFILFFSLPICRADGLEDDLSDGSDIEIDNSFGSDYDDDYTKNDYEKEPAESREGQKSSNGLTRSQICQPYDMSDFCVCERSCFPNVPTAFSPCICGKTDNNPNFSPPLLASQPSIPTYGSPYSSYNDCPSGNPTICACQKACIPGVPVNYDPCACMAMENPEPSASIFSDPNLGLQSFGSQNYGLQNFGSNLWGQSLAQPDFSNLVPQSSFNNGLTANSLLTENSCSRACLPYTVQSISPCACNFNLRSDNAGAFSPSMVPTGYNDGKASNKAVPIQQKMLNHDIPKVPRPETSIGAYLGCFTDKKKPGRDLKMSVPVPKLTPDSCINHCRERKKRFAAVQNGYLCFCGSRFGRYKRAKDEKCGTPCSGDPKKYCGGHWRNAVYSTDGQIYNPAQFSFTTPDPQDEKNSANELKKLSKHKRKRNSSKKHKTPLVEEKENKNLAETKDKKTEPVKVSSKNLKNKNETLKDQKRNYQHKTILETAKSPMDMAEIIAMGNKKHSSDPKKNVETKKFETEKKTEKNHRNPKIIKHT